MKEFLNSFHFPDVNVWLAFVYERHVHHREAFAWFETLRDEDRACFSRFTQISLLRLLTTEAVMRDEIMSRKQAWAIYDDLLADGRVIFVEEPANTELAFRTLTQSRQPSTKQWADAYIAAFAKSAGMTLVTFDRAMKMQVPGALLLHP